MGNSPGPVNSPHKGPVTRKMFPFDDVIMEVTIASWPHKSSANQLPVQQLGQVDNKRNTKAPHNWFFVRGIHRSRVNSPHKGQWRRALMFSLRLNKRLSKQSRGWWFGTLSRPLWRHCNALWWGCAVIGVFCYRLRGHIPGSLGRDHIS